MSLKQKIGKAAALRLSADDYIIQPFELETLLAMANKCIAEKAKYKEPDLIV